MISTVEQAHAIQARRFKAGKTGVAKAVRRYLRRTSPDNYKKVIAGFPTRWPEKKKIA